MLSKTIALTLLLGIAARADEIYLAPNGNDAWSGNLPAPNKTKSDGPLASLERARDVWRDRSTPATGKAKKIVVRGGTYYFKAPLALAPEDSGLQIVAYPQERPVLSGGKPITGWKKDGKSWTAKADWDFRMLRIGGENQTLARFPNFDAAHPTTGGWSFIAQEKEGGFGAALGNFDQWQAAGFDKNSIIADPLFTNAAADDYRLKPNSPALKLGFQELPWQKMGLAGFARSFQKSKFN